VIGGEPKSYKTWLTLDMAICLASGQSVFRKWAPSKKGTTLIYSPEGQGEGLRRRLFGLCIGMGLDWKEVLKSIPVIIEPVKVDDPEGYLKLGRTITHHNPDLLIMDPFVKLHSAEENDNIAIQGVLDLIRDLRKARKNLTTVLVHHTKKGGDSDGYGLRGASSLYGWLDTLITIRKEEGNFKRDLKVEHRDDLPPAPCSFYFQMVTEGEHTGFILEPVL
jgi:RecA-family ATPase